MSLWTQPHALSCTTCNLVSEGRCADLQVRITHDPFAPGMATRYGRPGDTDPDGFDPYADSVGPGIYGGGVLRDGSGRVAVGQQYQSHNPRPGPVYDGTGYSAMSKAIRYSHRRACTHTRACMRTHSSRLLVRVALSCMLE